LSLLSKEKFIPNKKVDSPNRAKKTKDEKRNVCDGDSGVLIVAIRMNMCY
jgi:hypothetical protein